MSGTTATHALRAAGVRALGGPGRGPRVPVLVALASALVLLAGAWLSLGRVVVHQCLPLDGPAGLIGVRLMLLSDVADCPSGTVALAPGAPQGAVLVLGLALPLIGAHAALAALGLGLAAVARRALRAAAGLVRAVVRALPAAHRPVVLRRPAALVRAVASAVPRGVPGPRHPRRGPPPALA